MDSNKITDKVSVAPQIAVNDIETIKAAGFKAIICNRPDGEGADQPTFEEIQKAAREAGLEAAYVPVQSGKVTDKNVEEFGAALKELPRPVLAYCRTGTRSATLWSLHEAVKRPLPEILAATKSAGYDMNGVARRIAAPGHDHTDTNGYKKSPRTAAHAHLQLHPELSARPTAVRRALERIRPEYTETPPPF